MVAAMKAYLSVFRIRFINCLQYRAVTLGEMLMRFAWAMMEILAFTALYRTKGAAFPMGLSETVTYVWIQQTLRVLFLVVFSDADIYSTISTGSIAYELVRPMSLYGRWFCQSAANRVAFAAVNCLPVLLVSLLMPEPYRLTLPPSLGQGLLFLLSMVLALGVVVAFAMLMYISLFYTLAQRGVKVIVTALTTFLSGGVIPLPFFPEQVLRLVRLLPFAAMQNTPILIFTGNTVGLEALGGIAFQAFWLAALIALGLFCIRRAQKKVIAQGG